MPVSRLHPSGYFCLSASGGAGNDYTPNSCQMVQHVMGETCVPLNPQRIVTLDGFGLDALLALGVQPVGAANPFSSYLDDRLVDIPLLGTYRKSLPWKGLSCSSRI
uniref:Uncharacterized protein n=1 Tax=Desertifilum tharense IPPAS B-1220 TaxID=1781255 RepID=A0ACD5GN64_9CYAN